MPRNYASLADQSVFPSISDLPGDYTCPETGGGVCGCLLVEIVSIERITRLVLRTFDRADSPVTVAFYTGDRGRSIENDPKLKPGNTMAILFPRRHLFLDGTVGVRQEHYGYFKFFPGNMKVLFQLSDEMRCWPARFATHKKCHGCGKKDKPLLRCAKCGVVTYCDKECQKAGWEEKEHKKMCKIIADRDFRTLVTISGRTDPVAEISFQMLRDAYERGLRAL
ncbi:zinc finger MYND domain-containing protein [Aspergillus vadensis CBS 113365]|uniref:MYND-type domain-containing protein n=1 Tax=Aspergillus vadensis (strain CBS 113365 / IMI 142717 / IBT 24658) TaxID=1448311 RepID=A0A319BEB8_ASPVC|nr:hypothetical protein BO88DRAFT_486419 [Aspergillus vadensis CBS 113365]PYH71065.1 hypothetical protein BO88DRAFT_486419 [Aspergillus vadensis CBS 113365]